MKIGDKIKYFGHSTPLLPKYGQEVIVEEIRPLSVKISFDDKTAVVDKSVLGVEPIKLVSTYLMDKQKILSEIEKIMKKVHEVNLTDLFEKLEKMNLKFNRNELTKWLQSLPEKYQVYKATWNLKLRLLPTIDEKVISTPVQSNLTEVFSFNDCYLRITKVFTKLKEYIIGQDECLWLELLSLLSGIKMKLHGDVGVGKKESFKKVSLLTGLNESYVFSHFDGENSILQYTVPSLLSKGDKEAVKQILLVYAKGKQNEVEPVMLKDQWDACKMWVDKVDIPQPVLDTIVSIAIAYNKASSKTTEQFLALAVKLVKTNSFMSGRTQAHPNDLAILEFVAPYFGIKNDVARIILQVVINNKTELIDSLQIKNKKYTSLEAEDTVNTLINYLKSEFGE